MVPSSRWSLICLATLCILAYQNCAEGFRSTVGVLSLDSQNPPQGSDDPGVDKTPPKDGVENPAPENPAMFPSNPVPASAELLLVSEGHDFVEGPVYVPELDSLIYSDLLRNTMFIVNGDGVLGVFRTNSSGSNGNVIDRMGRLITVEGSPRRQVVAYEPVTKEVMTLADNFNNMRFNAPNDLAVFKDNSIYFTDPTYNTPPGQLELGFRGVFRILPNGEVRAVVMEGFTQPNGILFSPDFTKLYVSDSQENHVLVFDVDGQGEVSNPQMFFDPEAEFGPSQGGGTDGMALDAAGNLYVTGDQAITIVRPDGTAVTQIEVGEQTTNCTFGGEDNKTLFITAGSSVRAINLLIPGYKPPAQ